ncbi:MAG: single-stranded DNA-binding protein [Acidimicrobiia bacterium]|nr:single-stranded DNA-binding protein [bacterium]MXX01791.1 single-stranded DNA-binding protein [Acidimicrobiia bacterium]MXX45026.1 single-stranded DNA-binding protein [Acidimicrobiia bacterium]MXY74529.1 single-stranded DNA-binding protein [Acidimicrobiia bacterium]MYA38543.1 single-stranded DNA-binding protein [Acidimicrobiia bacterium]
MAYNSVTLVGNLVEDPELRFTTSGIPRANIRLAVNRRWRDSNNEWQEETSFFSGTVWRQYAENVAESLQRGSRVIVTGRLQQRQWETSDGDRRSVVEVRIEEIGPSLRWATADVRRTTRENSGGYYDSGQRSSTPAGPVNPSGSFDRDEEPF